jgi:hypothetical protein
MVTGSRRFVGKRFRSAGFAQEMGNANADERSVWLETVTINEMLDASGWRDVLLLVMFD